MIEAAGNLLLDPIFVTGLIAGLIVVAMGFVLWVVFERGEVQRYGGLLVAIATMLVLYQANMLEGSQLVGVTLLAVAGVLHRSVAVRATLAIPGAFFMIRPDAGPQSWLPWFAMLGIVIAAPLVASFDDRYSRTGLPMPLLGISALGVFLVVPDTEAPMALLGVAGVAGFLGWPRPLFSLGGAGSFAAIGIYVFAATEGAISRPASFIASLAVLGILLIVPITIRLRSTGWAHELDRVNALIVLVAQLVLVLVISRTAGRIGWVPGAAVLTAAFMAAAIAIVLTLRSPRPSQLPD